MLGHLTFQCSIGLVILKLGLRPDPCVPWCSWVLKPQEAAGHQKEEPWTFSDGHQSESVIWPFSKLAATLHGTLHSPEFSQKGCYLSELGHPKAEDQGWLEYLRGTLSSRICSHGKPSKARFLPFEVCRNALTIRDYFFTSLLGQFLFFGQEYNSWLFVTIRWLYVTIFG